MLVFLTQLAEFVLDEENALSHVVQHVSHDDEKVGVLTLEVFRQHLSQ